MENIDFSVVIPTFRRPRELASAINSVRAQRGVTIEVLVIDDSLEGSAEATVNAIADPRITYFRNPQPTGGVPSQVRNLGWPHAKGAYIHFLDDDDLVTEDHYAAVKSEFDAHAAIGMVFGRIEPFGGASNAQLEDERMYFERAASRSVRSRRFGARWAFAGRMLFDQALLVCSASIARRECVAAIQGFDAEIRLMEDADYHLRLMREFGALYIDRPAVRYRIGSPSLMHSPNPPPEQRQQELEGRRKMQKKYKDQRGSFEFWSLALFTRTVLQIL